MNILGYPLGWIMWAIFQVVKNYGVALILFTVLFREMCIRDSLHTGLYQPEQTACNSCPDFRAPTC